MLSLPVLLPTLIPSISTLIHSTLRLPPTAKTLILSIDPGVLPLRPGVGTAQWSAAALNARKPSPPSNSQPKPPANSSPCAGAVGYVLARPPDRPGLVDRDVGKGKGISIGARISPRDSRVGPSLFRVRRRSKCGICGQSATRSGIPATTALLCHPIRSEQRGRPG